MVAKKAQQQQKTGCTHWHTRAHSQTLTHTSTGESKSAHHRYGCSGIGGQFAAAAATTTGSIVSCQRGERGQVGGVRPALEPGLDPSRNWMRVQNAMHFLTQRREMQMQMQMQRGGKHTHIHTGRPTHTRTHRHTCNSHSLLCLELSLGAAYVGNVFVIYF